MVPQTTGVPVFSREWKPSIPGAGRMAFEACPLGFYCDEGKGASTGYSVIVLAGIPNLHHAAGVRVESIHDRQSG